MCGISVDTGSTLTPTVFQVASDRIAHRGPDMNEMLVLPPVDMMADAVPQPQQESDAVRELPASVKLAFYRLAIMDPTHSGDQPFRSPSQQQLALCNGEIYNHLALREELAAATSCAAYPFVSHSDCEVLIPLYLAFGGMEGLVKRLDGEFAFAIVDYDAKDIFAARDPMGIRPLFYGRERSSRKMLFASEAKVLHPLCDVIDPFPPGFYYSSATDKWTCYSSLATVSRPWITDVEEAKRGIRSRLIAAVEKRLCADVPLGFLLSGGLDSSLVCAIAAAAALRTHKKDGSAAPRPLVTFAVGLDEAPIDIGYAREMAAALQSDHHEVLFTMAEVRAHLPSLIAQLETWDVTTIRASMGMSLLCKYIREKTTIRVVLTGEVSDELFGYKYTDFAPSAAAFQEESAKRVRELHMYDVLRADRCIAWHSLEARVPFSDTEFVEYCMAIDPSLKMNTHHMGKWLLRAAFDRQGEKEERDEEDDDLPLPQSILWREKAAFSDAVGHGMVDGLVADAAERFADDAEFERKRKSYPEKGRPLTKEGLMYREIFESVYPGRAGWIVDHWLPNQDWDHCKVVDPSARMLPNYGLSGV